MFEVKFDKKLRKAKNKSRCIWPKVENIHFEPRKHLLKKACDRFFHSNLKKVLLFFFIFSPLFSDRRPLFCSLVKYYTTLSPSPTPLFKTYLIHHFLLFVRIIMTLVTMTKQTTIWCSENPFEELVVEDVVESPILTISKTTSLDNADEKKIVMKK